MRYTRRELQALIAARHGQPETVGDGAFIDLHIRVTPELLEQMLGGVWEAADGKRARLEGLSIDSDGLAYPELVAEVPA